MDRLWGYVQEIRYGQHSRDMPPKLKRVQRRRHLSPHIWSSRHSVVLHVSHQGPTREARGRLLR
jgi:hypothetical protein